MNSTGVNSFYRPTKRPALAANRAIVLAQASPYISWKVVQFRSQSFALVLSRPD